jgi:hypothetical protein
MPWVGSNINFMLNTSANSSPHEPPSPHISLAQIDLQDVPSHVTTSLDAQPGVHIVVANNVSLVPYLVHYVAHCLASGQGLQAVPFPALPTAVLIDGTQRGFNETGRVARKFKLAKTGQPRTLHLVSELAIELHHQETLEVLRPHLAAKSHVVVRLCGASDLPRARETVARLDRMASDVGAYVTLIGTFGDGRSTRSRRHLAAEMFYADQAEEDPHCRLAWSMGSSELDYRSHFGNSRVLVQVKSDEGRLHIEQEPLIADKLIDRVIYKCHHSGLTMAETGTVVGRDKATISRILRTLPKRRQDAKLPDAWWETYLQTFTFTDEILSKLEKIRS